WSRAAPARNVRFGVREHGMGGVVNGMAGHGGMLRPYGSTFLQFADYMRGAIRLSALMGLEVAWVFTHDSVALGEDGPTHPPGLPAVSVEAAISMGWERWVDRSVSIERFGASAPGAEVLRNLGITGEHVASVARELLA